MASLYKKPIVKRDPVTGEKVVTKSRKWWGQFKGADGRLRRHPLATDKGASQAMLNELVRRVEREMAGLVDPTDQQRKRPLKEHITDFRSYLANRGTSDKQAGEATEQVRKMVNGCKWKFITDNSANGALNFLGELRRQGLAAQTSNNYLTSAKHFCGWLVRDLRAPTNPLAHLSKLNVATDRRHDRRPLCSEEFALLLEEAQAGKPIESIPGPDRVMMYKIAAWTGFRKGEIGSLTQRSLRLDAEPPSATVAACYSKRRREDRQVLHEELAKQLRSWLATKPSLKPTDLLFPVSGKVPGEIERKTNKFSSRSRRWNGSMGRRLKSFGESKSVVMSAVLRIECSQAYHWPSNIHKPSSHPLPSPGRFQGPLDHEHVIRRLVEGLPSCCPVSGHYGRHASSPPRYRPTDGPAETCLHCRGAGED